jgi:hypothetical protein
MLTNVAEEKENKKKKMKRKGIQSKPHKIYCPVTQSLNPVGTVH